MSRWTDERIDDLGRRVGAGFAELKAENRALRAELRSAMAEQRIELREEMNVRFAAVEGRFAGVERRLDLLMGSLVTGVAGVILSNLLS